MKRIVILVVTLTTCLVVGAAAKRCQRPAVRREVRELSREELRNLTDAMVAMYHLPSQADPTKSRQQLFSEVHHQNVAHSHDVPTFLAWHRHHLRQYELALQQINPSVNVPYWDWSLDSQAPHASAILTAAYFGGNGDRAANFTLRTGPFANLQLQYPYPHLLQRSFDRGETVTPFTYPEEIELYLNEPKFSDFSLLFEEKHGFPHLFVGGALGDFKPTYSPNDPLFFIHHGFVDYIWAEWQRRHPTAVQFETSRYYLYKGPTTLDTALTPYNNVTIRSLIDTQSEYYCYTYPGPYPRFIFPPRASASLKQEVARTINSSIVFHGELKGMTLQQALKYLRRHYLKYPTNPETALNTPGYLTKEWAQSIGFLMPYSIARNAANSVALADLLSRVPNFKSLAHFWNQLRA